MMSEVYEMKRIDTVTLKKSLAPRAWSLARLLLLLGISYTILCPILTKLSLVFMDSNDLYDYSIKWIPKNFTLDNIKISIHILDYWPTLIKSLVFCTVIALLQVAITTVSAYGFARHKSKFKNILFILVLATLLIPPQTYIVTLYTQFQYFDPFGICTLITGKPINLLDTVWVFVLLAITGMGIRGGLYIYVQKQTFSALPKEVEEAAKVDGAGMFRTFWSIMLPNVVPTIIMCFILSFIWHYNDTLYLSYFYPEFGTLSQEVSDMVFTVSYYLGGWATAGSTDASLLMSVGIFLCVIPLIILFLFCQRFFVQGVERSGIVG